MISLSKFRKDRAGTFAVCPNGCHAYQRCIMIGYFMCPCCSQVSTSLKTPTPFNP